MKPNYSARYGNLDQYKKLVAIAHRTTNNTCCYCLSRFPKRGETEVHHTRYLGKKDTIGQNVFILCVACHVMAHSDENWVSDRANPVWGSHSSPVFEEHLQSNFLLINTNGECHG